MMDHPQYSKIFKTSRPVVVAALYRYFNQLDDAEDAFQEACFRALKSWPIKDQPNNPTAWLIFVGRNIGIDQIRKQKHQTDIADVDRIITAPVESIEDDMLDHLSKQNFQDDILRLLFTCCHPSLSFEQQLALCLKLVGGLNIDEIAAAFVVKTKTIAQRITRAKAKIANLNIKFQTPSYQQSTTRLQQVRSAIYLLFNAGYTASNNKRAVNLLECQEAIRLARLLGRIFPDDAETMGLIALCLLQHSHAKARVDGDNNLVLLEHQNRQLWNKADIDEGSKLLEKAVAKGQVGSLQIQASIAATHANAKFYSQTNWAEISALYSLLSKIAPSPIVTLNHAAAIFMQGHVNEASLLANKLADVLRDYPYFHGLMAEINLKLNNKPQAIVHFNTALNLTKSVNEIAHIENKIKNL